MLNFCDVECIGNISTEFFGEVQLVRYGLVDGGWVIVKNEFYWTMNFDKDEACFFVVSSSGPDGLSLPHIFFKSAGSLAYDPKTQSQGIC